MWLCHYSGCILTFINKNVLFRCHFGHSVVLIMVTSWVSLTSTAHSPAGNVAPRARASEVQPWYVPLTRWQDVGNRGAGRSQSALCRQVLGRHAVLESFLVGFWVTVTLLISWNWTEGFCLFVFWFDYKFLTLLHVNLHLFPANVANVFVVNGFSSFDK